MVGQIPTARLHRVKPRPVVGIAFIEIDGLLHGSHRKAREPAHGLREVTVGARKILRPNGAALFPVHPAVAAAVATAAAPKAAEAGPEAAEAPSATGWGIHQTRERPFRILLVIGGQRDVSDAVLDAWKLAEWALE